MTPQLLYYENENLPPDARWLLWQWSYRLGLMNAWTGTLLSLYQKLHFSSHKGKSAMSALQAQGVIETTPQPAKGRGRPGYIYRITPSFHQALARLSDTQPGLFAYLQHLMETPLQTDIPSTPILDNEEQAGSHSQLSQAHARKNRLTIANRWVLTVLLAYADEHGAVTSVSQTQLQRLTGLAPSRWYSQRNKLMEMGLIARYFPGSAKKVRGVALNGVYLLDLTHPWVAMIKKADVKMILSPKREKHHEDTSLCELLVTALFELTHALGRVSFTRRSKLYQRYQDMFDLLPRDDYAASRWDVIRQLPLDPNLMARVRLWVHRAAMTYLNGREPLSGDIHTRFITSVKKMMRDRADFMNMVEANQQGALTKALCRLAMFLADELRCCLIMPSSLDLTVSRTYRLTSVALSQKDTPDSSARTSARTACWQLLGTSIDAHRHQEVSAGRVSSIYFSMAR